MAHGTELSNPTLHEPVVAPGESFTARALAAVRRVMARSIFWTYERGSWQYDIICALILAFIFLTPAAWFHDQPTLGLTNLRRTQGIIEIGHARDGWHYIIDARLVDSLAPASPNQAVGEILERRFHKPLTVESVVTLRDRNDVILGYTVVIRR
ncbi:MAG: hypothetical protein ACRD3D_16520 [Terriglobia bacterium]